MGSHSGDPDQAWPQSTGEEDLQLQLALAMSKEEAEQVNEWIHPGQRGYFMLCFFWFRSHLRMSSIHRGMLRILFPLTVYIALLSLFNC